VRPKLLAMLSLLDLLRVFSRAGKSSPPLLDMFREVLHEGFAGWEEVRRAGMELLKGIEFCL
jgi:hypothetical protein